MYMLYSVNILFFLAQSNVKAKNVDNNMYIMLCYFAYVVVKRKGMFFIGD